MEKRKLRRKCQGTCGRILDVDNMDYSYDEWSDEVYDNTVRWTNDPFAEEIHEEIIKMWLCGICYQELKDDI